MNPIDAYVGLGSNLHKPVAQVRAALQELDTLPNTRLTACSSLYRSSPLGPPGQPDYINAVARLATQLSAEALLTALQTLETRHGRLRAVRWGPRTLDLDILLYNDQINFDPHLTLPHPRLYERAFVLYPLYDIAPDLAIPGYGALSALLPQCPPLKMERLDL